MEWIFKNMPVGALIMLLPFITDKVGKALQDKDENSVGTDDVMGKICILAGPAVMAANLGNESAKKKSLEAIYQVLKQYLGKD